MKYRQGLYNIQVRFNTWSKDRLMSGKKLATSRTIRHGFVGDRFQVGPLWFEIVSIEKKTLADVTMNFFAMEGAESPEEFKKVWLSIHPRASWDPEKIVFYHVFKKVDKGYDVEKPKESFQISLIRDVGEN